jgi:polyisoprenoid-binding protein YceI
MKITTLFALTLVALSLNALADGGNTAKKPAPATLNVDTQKSTLNWLAKKVTGEHNGTINITKGSLTVDGTKLTGGSFEIDMTSIKCLDLTDAGYNGKLVDHLKSDDFFNVTSFPKAVFKITKVTPIAGAKVGEPNFTIVGDLTIRDKTNPVTFPATVGIKGGNVTASAKIAVDRSKYNVKFRSKSFFENLGDKMIYDEFEMNTTLVAGK